jgi:hypothetical protein
MFSTLQSFLPSALQNNEPRSPPPIKVEGDEPKSGPAKDRGMAADEMGVRKEKKKEKGTNEASAVG